MGIFDFGKKAREERERKAEEERQRKAAEEAERKRLAEEERKRKAAEEAERQRKAEEERKRLAAEEAERQRKAEEERKRLAAEEAERKRKAEEERKRKAAEEAESQRKAEEERKRKAAEEAKRKRKAEAERKKQQEEEQKRKREEEARKLMAVYDNFASHTSVNCKAFADAGFQCNFDDMEYTAEISPAEKYIDSSYVKDGKYNIEDGKKTPSSYSTTVALDLKMICVGGKCVLYPRINVRCWFGTRFGQKTIEKMYIKVGENRYVATLPNVTTYTERSNYGSYETDYATLALGADDIDILRQIATGKYQSKIRLGNGEGRMELTDKDVRDIKSFLDVCDRAGVFEQALFKAEAARFSAITLFNT